MHARLEPLPTTELLEEKKKDAASIFIAFDSINLFSYIISS